MSDWGSRARIKELEDEVKRLEKLLDGASKPTDTDRCPLCNGALPCSRASCPQHP